MDGLWSRLAFGPDGPVLKTPGVAVVEIVGKLESGETWEGLQSSLNVAPADLVAAIGAAALGDDNELGPTLIQTKPERPQLVQALSEPALAAAGIDGDRASRLALAAGLLQIHDFWNASHEAAQASDDLGERATSAYWHAIAHRREPDAGNAMYWFRRVGRHPVFADLDEQARPILEAAMDTSLAAPFTRSAGWDPSTLVDLASRARSGTAAETLARRLQRLEMRLLVEASAAAVGLG